MENWFVKSTSGISDTMVTLIDNGAFGYSWHGTVRSTASAQKAVWASSSVKKGYCRFYSGTGVQRQLLRGHRGCAPSLIARRVRGADVRRNRHSIVAVVAVGLGLALGGVASGVFRAAGNALGHTRHPLAGRYAPLSVAQFPDGDRPSRPPGGAPAHTGRVPLRLGHTRRDRRARSRRLQPRDRPARRAKAVRQPRLRRRPRARDRPRCPPQRHRRSRRRGREARHERRLDAVAAALAPIDACTWRARTTARSPTASGDATSRGRHSRRRARARPPTDGCSTVSRRYRLNRVG